MILRFRNGAIAAASGVLTAADIALEAGRIAAIGPAGAGTADRVVDLAGGWLLPGFVDTQVNGGGGVLFNDQLDADGIAAIGAAHARFGTTAFLPTLISDTPVRIGAALDAVDAAIEAGVPGVVGVHIEGPFLNPARRGIHEPAALRPLDADTLDLLAAPRRGRVMVTLAPECCAADDIRTLVRRGVIVSAGHTDATYDEAQAALALGVTGFTHLFNAMSPFRHRDPGVVGAALDGDPDGGAWCGLIVDGTHLHPAAVRLAVRAKPGRIMLVSDAMPTVGTDADRFVLQGKTILVKDGICRFEDGTLAGAHLDMAAALRNTVSITGLGVPAVAAMASAHPARFLSIDDAHGSIAPGMRADFAILDAGLNPRETWIGGSPVRHASANVAAWA
jgi:N-acetylglucosamine-6-phosphate deacetylase